MILRISMLTAALLLMPAAGRSEVVLPEAQPPTFTQNLAAGQDLTPIFPLPIPRHVAIDEGCAQRSLVSWSSSGIDGSLYAYELPAIPLGFAPHNWDSAAYLVMTGIDDRSPYEAHTNTDKVRRVLDGSDEHVPLVSGEPLVNVFIHGAFVSSSKLVPPAGIGFDIVLDDGTVITTGRLTPLQLITHPDSSFTWSSGVDAETTISPACLSDGTAPTREFQFLKQPVAVFTYQDIGRIHFHNGADAEGAYLADVMQTRFQLGRLQALLSAPSPAPAEVKNLVALIQGTLDRFDNFDVQPPSRTALAQLLESVRNTADSSEAYQTAYADLRDAATVNDARLRLKYAQVAQSLLAGLDGITNSRDLMTAAGGLEDDARKTLAAQERARAAAVAAAARAAHQRAQAEAAAAARAATQRRRAVQRLANQYKRDQRRLILQYSRLPDAIDTVTEDGLKYERWRWGSVRYVFAPDGTMLRQE